MNHKKTLSSGVSPHGLSLAFAVLCLAFVCGCATAPVMEGIPSYSIRGVHYIPLVSLCDLKNISLTYDTFTRTAELKKNSTVVNVHAGDAVILVNGKAQNHDNPVCLYRDVLVVPYSFRDSVVEPLFKSGVLQEKKAFPASRVKKVIIDPGHGGKDPGAIGRTGLREKDVVLDIAKRLAVLFRNEGIEVVLTRSTDTFIPLARRVDKTNASHADLFLSIHANANRNRNVRGFEVYYVSSSVNDFDRAVSAARDDAPHLGVLSVSGASLNLKATLWDMIYGYSRAESMELGRSICKSVQCEVNNKISGIKSARYYVLKGARMPAVLIEVGYLSNMDEERCLKNGFYRQQIAEGIKAGLFDYSQQICWQYK
ncbi:MAG: N-acetylmuramoyl-L-alanine amidase [Candidatus Omnitrophica bacterium]|nr:N-acetylmuramoyl-L-alanine amidase [Candidatus Omnitrophota bacterium]